MEDFCHYFNTLKIQNYQCDRENEKIIPRFFSVLNGVIIKHAFKIYFNMPWYILSSIV